MPKKRSLTAAFLYKKRNTVSLQRTTIPCLSKFCQDVYSKMFYKKLQTFINIATYCQYFLQTGFCFTLLQQNSFFRLTIASVNKFIFEKYIFSSVFKKNLPSPYKNNFVLYFITIFFKIPNPFYKKHSYKKQYIIYSIFTSVYCFSYTHTLHHCLFICQYIY